MADVPLERRFAGQARLVRLLLWRIGDSTDIDACLAVARQARMIDADDEAFLRGCLEAEERQRASSESTDASSIADIDEHMAPLGCAIDETTIARLQRCVDKLNRADSA